jgi:hypothetical protein
VQPCARAQSCAARSSAPPAGGVDREVLDPAAPPVPDGLEVRVGGAEPGHVARHQDGRRLRLDRPHQALGGDRAVPPGRRRAGRREEPPVRRDEGRHVVGHGGADVHRGQASLGGVSLERRVEDPGERRDRTTWVEERRRDAPGVLAVGTLACPRCDVPVSPDRPLRPADALRCPLCDHAGRVRDFLSLAQPARPARVEVTVRGGRPLVRRAR